MQKKRCQPNPNFSFVNVLSNWLIRLAQTADKQTLLLQKYHLTPEQLQLHLNADPTPTKKYVEWLIRKTTSTPPTLRLPEDASKCIETLSLFEAKKQFLDQKDINKYDSLGTLTQALEQVTGQTSKREKVRVNTQQGQQLVAQDGEYKCVKITTEEAAASLCRKTEWCIKDPTYFRQYNIDGSNPLYMFLEKDIPFALLNVRSKQFNDVYDKAISSQQKQKLTPILDELLQTGEFYNAINVNNPEEAYNLSYSIGKRVPQLEHVIMQDPKWAYYYAGDVIQGRWPEVEPIIMKNPKWAYLYARGIMKRRWPEAEPIIMRSPQFAYEYARYIVKGRWPEAEPVIMQDPQWAYCYAQYVIRGRWPEAESYIMKAPEYAYMYTSNLIHGRWPEAEPRIMRDPYMACMYASDIIKDRWPEAEPYIMKSPQYACWYAIYVLRARWPEAESVIMKKPKWADQYKNIFPNKMSIITRQERK